MIQPVLIIGEDIIDEGLAVKIAIRVRNGFKLEKAFAKTLAEARSRKRKMGAIGLDTKGNVAHLMTTETLIFAWKKGLKTGCF